MGGKKIWKPPMAETIFLGEIALLKEFVGDQSPKTQVDSQNALKFISDAQTPLEDRLFAIELLARSKLKGTLMNAMGDRKLEKEVRTALGIALLSTDSVFGARSRRELGREMERLLEKTEIRKEKALMKNRVRVPS